VWQPSSNSPAATRTIEHNRIAVRDRSTSFFPIKVSMIFPTACIGDRLYPRPLANFLNVYFRRHGVDVHFCERVDRIDRHNGKLLVRTNGNDDIAVDAVVAGIGIEPNVHLAKAAGDARTGRNAKPIELEIPQRTAHPNRVSGRRFPRSGKTIFGRWRQKAPNCL
jgi:phytoene dehydrogenase-like protein